MFADCAAALRLQSIVEGDIKKYLNEALRSIPSPPSDEHIATNGVYRGLFIYAATAVQYILSGKTPSPNFITECDSGDGSVVERKRRV